jgi:cytochrome c5
MPGKTQWFGLAALAVASQFWVLPSLAEIPGYASDTRAYNLAHGRVVFMDKCMRCHESGDEGAPVLGDAGDWQERLEQPLDTLIEHAIAGHGDMPACGDRDVSEQDVAAAVAFAVDRTRKTIVIDVNSLPPPAAGASADYADDASDRASVHIFMLMLRKARWR